MVAEMGEITQINKNLRVAMVQLLKKKNKIEVQRSWLERRGLETTVLTDMINDYETQKSEIDSLVSRESSLNNVLYQKYRSLKPHTVKKALGDLMKVKHENIVN